MTVIKHTENIPERVFLGVRGWEWPAWHEAFYPADMPEDWRLTFFNTQFSCVFLDAAIWSHAGAEAWARWRCETHDGFVFLLEACEGKTAPSELLDKSVVLDRDDPRIVWFDRDTDMKALASVLTGKTRGWPCFVISRDADLAQLERVATLLELLGL